MYSAFRVQLEALDLMCGSQQLSSVQVSQIKDINPSTLRNWKQHFLLFGETPEETRRTNLLRGPRVENRKLTPDLKVEILRIIRQYPFSYLDELQTKLFESTGCLVSISQLQRVLTGELRWSLQVAQARASEQDEIERAEHRAFMYEVTDDPYQFIFLDESAKDRNASRRRRCWQPIGLNDVSEFFSDRNDFLYTLIAAADMNGFVGEACEIVRRRRGERDDDIEAGTVDADRFVAWVEERLCPTLGNYFLGERRSIVVMDNASIHLDERVRTLIEGKGALLIYQSSYSPDFDPIEKCFRQYKASLRRNAALGAILPYEAHWQALQTVSSSNMRAYYRKMGFIKNVPDELTVYSKTQLLATIISNNMATVAIHSLQH